MNFKELPKAYEPQKYEEEIYQKWEESGYFNPDNLDLDEDAENFVISMPPPNVTGVLHLGHALENTIMDIAVRYNRMNGKKAMIVPGTDHAAVATQAKVEKLLVKEGIKNPRQEFGREKLLEKIREYAEESKATILKQIRKMGASCDWSRLAYTFDDVRTKAVNEVFTRMYSDGLIYRGYRVVNWSVKGQSTCSDDELVHIEKKTKIYTFRYTKDFPISISTVRPETKLGDTAVAVNPNDEKYKEYIGKTYTVDVGAKKPLEIKIIADENVDPEFGSGAVGVTPAHSMIDYEMYEKQGLDLIVVIGKDGCMTENAGKNYEGLTVLEAREKFVAWLRDNDLMESEEEIIHNVGTSDRFNDVIEVLPMEQWFVDVNKEIPGKGKSLKDLMREAVTIGHNGDKEKKITIVPDRFNNQYFHWIDNLRDWCISRQIWWGHRIPAWHKDGEIKASVESPGEGWVQDEDTFDTWFSSGLWTFSTLGWPEQTDDFKNFHPTDWMQMGYEILFFWMARMILMSTYAVDDIPFKDVYIHGMLRDKNNQKFSKSLGNGIDPLEVCEQYGTDALRLSLITGTTPGNDSRFYEEKVEDARNFVNKLWNISRYVLGSVDKEKLSADIDSSKLTFSDKWILEKMRSLIIDVNENLDAYRFSQAVETLKEFTRNYLADWYLEASKFEQSSQKEKVLYAIMSDLLKLWHPFLPFVTENIWQNFNSNFLMIQKWPQASDYTNILKSLNQAELFIFERTKDIIGGIRNARSEHKIEPAIKIKAVIIAGKFLEEIKYQEELIIKMRTGISELEILETGEEPEDAIQIVVGDVKIYLIGAVDKEKEQERLGKEKERLSNLIQNIEKKLANKEYVEKAPKELVEKTRENLENFKKELVAISS